MKSLGHSTMAISEVVLPYLDNPDDKSWVAPMQAYLTEMKSALDGIGAAEMPDDWRPNSRAILENNIAFMEDCLAKGMISLDAVQAFAKKQAPVLRHAIAWAAQTQVKHWMGVLDDWKQDLGGSFDQVYGASNTIYVARQNNVLFSVLAQYFGPKAINDRLMLIETIHARRHAHIARSHHLRPLCRRTVLQQLSSDGLRTDGRRRAQDHHLGDEGARTGTVPAASGAVRLQPVAGTHFGRLRRCVSRRSSMSHIPDAEDPASGAGSACRWNMRKFIFASLLATGLALTPALAQSSTDWITRLPRQDIPVASWPEGKKVAVTFVLNVEVWRHGHGPNFRPDMTGRTPDLVDEGFRQYAINFGLPRTGRLFKETGVPLSLALNAQFPQAQPETWQALRALVPTAPIIAHGLNNSTDLLPLSEGPAAQRAYICKTLDMIEASTGVRSVGWSSPSVYPDAETFQASAWR